MSAGGKPHRQKGVKTKSMQKKKDTGRARRQTDQGGQVGLSPVTGCDTTRANTQTEKRRSREEEKTP